MTCGEAMVVATRYRAVARAMGAAALEAADGRRLCREEAACALAGFEAGADAVCEALLHGVMADPADDARLAVLGLLRDAPARRDAILGE